MIQVITDNSAVAQSQNYAVLEFLFKPAAVGTHGHKFVLIAQQACVDAKAFMYIGDGTFVPPTVAICDALVKDPLDTSLATPTGFVQNPYAESASQLQILSTGIKNFMATLVDSSTTAGYSLGFAVGGVKIKDLLSVEVSIIAGSGALAPGGCGWNSEAMLRLANPMSLGATSNLIVTGTTEIAIGTDNLMLAPTGQVFGAFNVDEDTLVHAADKGIVCLKLRVIL